MTLKATNVGLIRSLIPEKYMKIIRVGLNVFLHFLSILSAMCLCEDKEIMLVVNS